MPEISEGQAEDLQQTSTSSENQKGYGRAINLSFDEEPAESEAVDSTDEEVSDPEQEVDTEVETKKGQAEDEDSDEDSEDSANDSDSEDDDVKEKNRRGFKERQRRKLELFEARQKAEQAEREKEELLKRLEALEKGEKPVKRSQSVNEGLPEHLQKEPDPADFDTHAAYTRAVARHEHAIIQWESEQAKQKSQVLERQQSIKNKLTSAVETALDKYEDFLDLTEGQPQRATPAVIEYLETVDTDMLPEMLYYFGQNPDEYDKIVSSGPIAAAKALARIEGKLESVKPTAKKVEVKKDLPAPIKPIKSGSGKKVSAIEDPKSSYRDLRSELMKAKKR